MPELSVHQAPAKCSCCQRPMENPVVCAGCHTLHDAGAQQDYFRIFGLERRFALDPADLRRRFLGLSREIHPDRFASDGSDASGRSVEISARVNRAYEVLADPALRADYLLELAGGPSAAADRSVPPAILSQTLVLREEIDEARAAGDTAALSRIREQARVQREDALGRIAGLADLLPGDATARSALRRELNSLKYIDNLLEQVEA